MRTILQVLGIETAAELGARGVIQLAKTVMGEFATKFQVSEETLKQTLRDNRALLVYIHDRMDPPPSEVLSTHQAGLSDYEEDRTAYDLILALLFIEKRVREGQENATIADVTREQVAFMNSICASSQKLIRALRELDENREKAWWAKAKEAGQSVNDGINTNQTINRATNFFQGRSDEIRRRQGRDTRNW